MSIQTNEKQWQTICGLDDLVENSGVCALLADETQVAIFKLPTAVVEDEQEVYAISNFDPIGKANVLYRGIVGCNQGEPVVASPLYKQQFSLKTGKCLQEESFVSAYQTRVHDKQVQILA